MNIIEVAIIKLIGPGEPTPTGHTLIKLEDQKYYRLIGVVSANRRNFRSS